MAVEDSWYTLDRATGKKVPTKRHGRGKRWRVRNRGARTLSFDKKTDADKYDVKVRAELAQGLLPFDTRAGLITFKEYAGKKWLPEHHYDSNSRDTVESRLENHVYPTFGPKRMRDIRVTTVTEWWAAMRDKRQPNGKPYAAATLQAVASHTGSIFRAALLDGVIPTDPFAATKLSVPQRDARARDLWEGERVGTVLDGLSDRDRPIGFVSATCGHRPGEALAVALEDLNRFRKEVTIRHQVKRVGGKLVLTPPKRGKIRTVPLPDVTAAALTAHADAYGTTPVPCTCCGKTWHLLFTDDQGRLINSSDWAREAWYPALVAAGLSPSRANGRHVLRHYFVSLLIEGGATPQQVRDYCGHASIKTTLDVYGHLFEPSHERARSIIDTAFSAGVYPLRTGEAY